MLKLKLLNRRMGWWIQMMLGIYQKEEETCQRHHKTVQMAKNCKLTCSDALFWLFSNVHATLYTTVSVRWLVGWLVSVGWSVYWLVGIAFVFSAFSHHYSCPIARDWFCRVYGLVFTQRKKRCLNGPTTLLHSHEFPFQFRATNRHTDQPTCYW